LSEDRDREAGERSAYEGIWQEIHGRIEALSHDLSGEITEEELHDLWYRRALELSRSQEARADAGGSLKMITFRLGSDRYGVSLEMVREIQRAGRITPVPTAPDFVSGVVNLRGNVLSVVDIRVFFSLPGVVMGEKTRILVVEDEGLIVGILVEKVDEIVDVSMEGVKPPLSLDKGITEDYIQGIATHRGEMLIIIDLEKILKNPRLVVEENV
jgi:purine-binding chemotaxis protein CheW